MQTNYAFKHIDLNTVEKKALEKCTKEMERKVPDLEVVSFNFKPKPHRDNEVLIDVRAKSHSADVIASISSNSVLSGLKAIKNLTILKLREKKNKIISKTRRRRRAYTPKDYFFDLNHNNNSDEGEK